MQRVMVAVALVLGLTVVAGPLAATAASAATQSPARTSSSACASSKADAYAALGLTDSNSVGTRNNWRLTAGSHSASGKIDMTLTLSGGGNGTFKWFAQNGGHVKWKWWRVYVERPKQNADGTWTWTVQKLSSGGSNSITVSLSLPAGAPNGIRVICYGVFRWPNPASCRPISDSSPWLSN